MKVDRSTLSPTFNHSCIERVTIVSAFTSVLHGLRRSIRPISDPIRGVPERI